MISDKITGKGLIFPIELQNGSVVSQGGIELIRSCIHNILAFEFGERYFQRDFGVGLDTLLGEPNDRVTEYLLNHRIRTQLPLWDNRVTITDITAQRNTIDSTLLVRVTVSLTGTDQTEELIFPINNTL